MRRIASAAIATFTMVTMLTGCSSSASEGPADEARATQPTSNSPAPDAASAPYDTTLEIAGEPRISAAAVNRYGAEGAAAGTTAALDVVEEFGYNDTLIASKEGDNLDTLLSASDDMTPAAAKDWKRAVKGYLDGHQGSAATVYAYAWYAPNRGAKFEGKPVWAAEEGPAAVNKEIKNVEATVDDEGRLVVEAVNIGDLRVVHGKTAKLWTIERTSTLYMQKTNDGWKVDRWAATWNMGDMRVDK